MHVFFAPEISRTNSLPPEESYHAIKVLRLRKGSLISVVDGSGGFYEAEIEVENPSEVLLKIVLNKQNYDARPYRLHIALAPTKNSDSFEFFLEKAVEIGVDEITPLICEHTERFKLRIDRLERIIISAMKQSYKAYRPKLNPISSFDSAIENAKGRVGIAHCYESPKLQMKEFLLDAAKSKAKDIEIFIGPEGDFSPAEILAAEKKGFTGISLGSSRLRTETAGVVACFAVNYELSKPEPF